MKQIWLVPLDGSETSLRAIDWVIDNIGNLQEVPEIHLLNVQSALPRDIGRFISSEAVQDFHRESGLAALAAGKALLNARQIDTTEHVLVGEIAPTIRDFADHHHCSTIVLGTHGHTGLTGTLLGSVAMRVAHLSTTPVMLVR